MLNHSQEPQKAKPEVITLQDDHNNIVELPVQQENQIAIFKKMGYRIVHLETEILPDERE